jgi:hypothetical protein
MATFIPNDALTIIAGSAVAASPVGSELDLRGERKETVFRPQTDGRHAQSTFRVRPTSYLPPVLCGYLLTRYQYEQRCRF